MEKSENLKKWQVDFGKRLRDEREKQGLTRQALAKQADTSHDYITQIERGSKCPSLHTFMRLIFSLDISPDVLLYETIYEYENERERTIKGINLQLYRLNLNELLALNDIMKFMLKYILGLKHRI